MEFWDEYLSQMELVLIYDADAFTNCSCIFSPFVIYFISQEYAVTMW